MNFFYSKRSLKILENTSQSIRSIMYDALAIGLMDIAIIESHRTEDLQNNYYISGKSKVEWPNSKHNKLPSEAIDAAPYVDGKVSWNRYHCCVLSGIIMTCAVKHGIRLRWGGNWDMDSEPITDQDFQDLVHYEEV